jgi:hypothetical protein
VAETLFAASLFSEPLVLDSSSGSRERQVDVCQEVGFRSFLRIIEVFLPHRHVLTLSGETPMTLTRRFGSSLGCGSTIVASDYCAPSGLRSFDATRTQGCALGYNVAPFQGSVQENMSSPNGAK